MKKTQIKNATPFITLVSAVFTFALGLFTIFGDSQSVNVLFLDVLKIIVLLWGTSKMANLFAEGKTKNGIILMTIVTIVAVIIASFKSFAVSTIIIAVGIFSILVGLIRLAITVYLISQGNPGIFRSIVSVILCFTFATFLLVVPSTKTAALQLVTGIYLILYSFTMFGDFTAELFKTDLADNKFKRRVHFALPNFITAFIPNNMIKKFNKVLEQNDPNNAMMIDEKYVEGYDQVNFEVLVHMSKALLKRFGHVDICIDDKVYSYGTYNSKTDKLGGMLSQGTFIIVPKDKYIKDCLTKQNKYIVAFGMCLSKEQLAAVHDRINEILSETVPLESDYEKGLKDGLSKEKLDSLSDPASRVVRDMGGKVHTVIKGPFRTYFGVSSNCVQLADTITGKAGIDAISFNGIRTPGAYYSMMDDMFSRKNTRVIRRTTYLEVGKTEEEISEDIKNSNKSSDSKSENE